MSAPKPAKRPAPSFRLSLHIRHPSLGPQEISRELRLEADESFAAGEPRHPRSGAAPESVHGETYWAAALDPAHWLVSGERAGSSSAADDFGAPRAPARVRSEPAVRHAPPEAMLRWAGMAALAGARNLGVTLSLVCARLWGRHGEFLRRMHSEGGSLTLRATVAPHAIQGFRITPQVSQWMSDLRMTFELESLDG